jgi:hypothetical protein
LAARTNLSVYLFTFVLVSGSAAAFVGMTIGASDDLATWMIHNAIGQETFAHKIGTLLGVSLQGAPPVGFAATATVAFATIVLGILACLAMIGQVMIMLLRGAMLIALVGTLPAAAAASNTEIGMMWFKKQIAWVTLGRRTRWRRRSSTPLLFCCLGRVVLTRFCLACCC